MTGNLEIILVWLNVVSTEPCHKITMLGSRNGPLSELKNIDSMKHQHFAAQEM